MPHRSLSVSQIKSIDVCKRKYYHDYIILRREQIPQGLCGGSVHVALENNYKQKIVTGKDLSYQEVQELFFEDFLKNQDSVTKWGNKGRDYYLETSLLMLDNHLDNIAPGIQPLSTEERIKFDLDGIPMKGFVDLQTQDSVLDFKFRYATNKPRLDVDTDLQLTTYAYATGKKKVGFIMHWFLPPNKTRRVQVPVSGSFYSSRDTDSFNELKKKVRSVAEDIDRCRTNLEFPKLPLRECPRWCEYLSLCHGPAKAEYDKEMKEKLIDTEDK